MAIGGWVVVGFFPSFSWLAVLLTAPVGLLMWEAMRTQSLVARARGTWHPRGVVGLLVYSRSPNWQEHIERNWLPTLGGRLEILNWSDRRLWDPRDLRVAVFRHYFGSLEDDYNPVVMLFPIDGPPVTFRFYPAFMNAKHGNREGLEMLERELFERMGSTFMPEANPADSR